MSEADLAHAILDAEDDALFLLDASGVISAMNRSAERLTGYCEAELVGRRLPGRNIVENIFDEPMFATSEPPEGLHVRVRRKDGTAVDADYAMRPLAAAARSMNILRLRPRSHEQASESALDDTIKKLAAIFGGMSDGLVLIDEIGVMRLFSAGAERLFGYSASEAVGANVKMLMPSPFREAHDAYLRAYRETGVKKIIGIGREVAGQRKDGSVFPMYLSIGEIWLSGERYFVGMTHDLTRLKMAEERLLTVSAAMDQSPVGFLIADKAGQIQYVNSAFARLTGYAAEELLGENPRLLQSKKTQREQYRRLWDTIRQGREWRGEIQDRRKDGSLYWALEMITPLRDASGRVTHYLAIQQDITEQKRDKEALAESEERFRKVAEMAGEWLWEQDAQGHYTYSSGAVRNILGVQPEEIVGKTYSSLFVPDCTLLSDAAPRPQANAEFHRVVNCYRRKDGRRVFTESSGAPIFDNKGRLIKWRGVDRDITAEKEYEDRLRVRDRAIESLHVGIAISDARAAGHPNIYVNPALSRITGYSRQELLGHSMNLLQGPETDPEALREIKRALARGEGCEVTLKNYRKNGEAFWNELVISPVRDGNGVITHYVDIHTDVTERRRAEESRRELEIAKQIQLSLLPDTPLCAAGAMIFGVCKPATHVGGDYFDYFENAGSLDAAIADVSGHSVGAALMMTVVRSMLRAEARKADGRSNPAAVLRELNDLLYGDLTQAELFITMFYCRYEPANRLLRYANGGHNPALLLRSHESRCRHLDGDGLVLGVKSAAEFEDCSLVLQTGDKLLLYTDGVTESQSPAGEFYGVERLCSAFEANGHLSPQPLVHGILEDMRRFRERIPASDDIAMVAMQII
ncbi:PAS domain S-box protein [Methylocystis sp. JAN1]|uniref:PAS domain S-box protein n=1 Tax=Methylocystis sp. JAN1 TaxID=3397211 RepID=UPI003FA28C30